MTTKPIYLSVLLFGLGACAWQASAQPAFDSTGDGMLNGTYYFRQVLYDAVQQDSMSLVGNIAFDGQGNYTLSNATILDAATGSSTPQSFSASGTYAVAASGQAILTAFNPTVNATDQIVGLVSPSGLLIGSSTENTVGYNDLFIAAPVGSVPATNATLSGSYRVAYFDPTYPGDAILNFNANGNGNIGNVTTTQYVENASTTAAKVDTRTPTLTGVTYSFSDGAAQINFGGKVSGTNFVAGTEILYTTPDGNFIFGGSFNGFDMFVGVRNAASAPANSQALYYQAGTDDDFTGFPNNNGLDSYFGAANVLSNNSIIAHQRLNLGGSEDYTYYDFYTQNSDGSASDSFYQYWSTADGTVRIGYGAPDPSSGINSIGINVAFQGPALNPTGSVYLSPVGVVNAASNAPFTAFVSPGEFVTLYGAGIANTTDSAGLPFPKKLDGVTVTVNGVQAPIYFVSPNQISIVVPYITTPGSIAQIQVNNNGVASNTVTPFTGTTSVGVFTTDQTGIGIAAAERQNDNYSIVSESNPAQANDALALYVSGMGAVSPAVSDGQAAPSSPLSNTQQSPAIFFYDTQDANTAQAMPAFSGLAPGFAGLYQINFSMPSGLSSNDTILDLYSGLDSETLESILPVSAGGSARPAAHPQKHPRITRHKHNPAPHLRGSRRTVSEPR